MSTPPSAYVPLSVDYSDDDRIIDAGPLAELVWVRCLARAGRLWQQDGFLTRRQVDRVVADLADVRTSLEAADPVTELVRVGLLRPDDDDPHRPGYRLRSWTAWNSTADEIIERKEAVRTGNRTRQQNRRERLKQSKSAETEVTPESRRDVTVDHEMTERESHACSSTASTSATAAAAAKPPPPPGEISNDQMAGLRELAAGLTAAGLLVSWKLDDTELHRIVNALERCGHKALVDYAKRRHRPDSPAFSVKAWIEGWEQLPALRLVQQSKPVPCTRHMAEDAAHCSGCAADRKAGT